MKPEKAELHIIKKKSRLSQNIQNTKNFDLPIKICGFWKFLPKWFKFCMLYVNNLKAQVVLRRYELHVRDKIRKSYIYQLPALTNVHVLPRWTKPNASSTLRYECVLIQYLGKELQHIHAMTWRYIHKICRHFIIQRILLWIYKTKIYFKYTFNTVCHKTCLLSIFGMRKIMPINRKPRLNFLHSFTYINFILLMWNRNVFKNISI